ncbi:3-keto-disaccharide hydrolase [Seonamhaeicola maritimus]|uniref:DUF1080 domain-containing protein n=1 Tax=Seonamhaeicola maritimus TaxID=2591822 RepID=A0A5C7GJQ0_9FLAO|nr:DUF1080 domain-containing protein [Seonamhaeicola maritimus]TXG38504.1 DUF1080 domain-containing protein [Seonamhaeicola maritimus]
MKTLIYILFIFTIFLSCKENNNNTQASIQGEWETLFDGSSFDNWKVYLKEDISSAWAMEDGAMVLDKADHSNNIITKSKYTNFILSLEWKIAEGGNSGVFWGVHEDENLNQAYQTGPEIQVLDNERHPDAKANPKYHQAGALYDMVQPSQDVCKSAGEWNACEIKINHKTNQGSVKLNGTLIVKFPVHGQAWDAMVLNSKFKGWEHFGKYHTGHIGLQDHGDKVWYRNIKIKEL